MLRAGELLLAPISVDAMLYLSYRTDSFEATMDIFISVEPTTNEAVCFR
jgi:hypothetical protein